MLIKAGCSPLKFAVLPVANLNDVAAGLFITAFNVGPEYHFNKRREAKPSSTCLGNLWK